MTAAPRPRPAAEASAPVAAPVIAIRDLDIALPPGADRPLAVQGLNLELHPSEILCVVGESGSGKSMLASAMMGLLPHGVAVSGGSVTLAGRDVTRLPEAEWRSLRGARISMVFQEPMTALNPVLTVHEQIDEVLRAHGMADARARDARILELLHATGLPEPERLQRAYPFRLSGGQRQRVMISAALAMEPDVLIADEPTTALDVTTQKQILQLLKDIQAERSLAILFITHDFGVVADIADRVAVMQNGEVVESGAAAEVLGAPRHPYTRRLIEAVRGLSRGPDAQAAVGAPVLEVRDVSKVYRTRSGFFSAQVREVQALRNVSISVGHGETLGLVGESGSGKSTLGQVVVQLEQAQGGKVLFRGENLAEMERAAFRRVRPKIQMIFQDPYASLNPRHRIGRVLTETQRLHGTPRDEARAKAERMLEMVALDRSAMDRYPHEFSGGQRQRIGIARALVLEPELIVADEPVSALDVSIQAQVLELLAEIRRRMQLSMLFITHDLRVAAQVCDRIAVMQQGSIVEMGPAEQVLRSPRHAYTRLLCDSMPGGAWFAQ